MSEMITLTIIVATVSLHAGNIVGLVFGLFGLVTPVLVAIIGLVVAALILIGALVYFRGSGKKKAASGASASGTTDWQRQAQQGAPGTMNAWNQQAMPANNAWGQAGQQPNPWGAQAAPQQAGNWDAQQQAGAWGAQNPAQMQPGTWGAQNQQQGWGTQTPIPQQGGWGAQDAAQQGWAAQNAAQQQSAPAWGAQTPAQQQQQPAWGTQVSGMGQQPQPAPWANQGAQLAGMEAAGRSSQPWESPAPPSSQDQWGQQQSAPAWGVPGNAPAQPGSASAFGSGSGQSWGQPAQPVDPWAQQGGWAQAYQPQAPSAPVGQPGNAALPPWQQPGPVPGQGQSGFGNVAQGGFGSAGAYAGEDGDRTMLRNTGAQTQNRLGIVRIEEGKEPGRVYEIRKDSLSIGRSRESDVFLEDLAVSRLHASIINMGNGNYALRDEGSANGTKVNGQTVNKYQPFPLKEGDKIQLGQTVLVFAKR